MFLSTTYHGLELLVTLFLIFLHRLACVVSEGERDVDGWIVFFYYTRLPLYACREGKPDGAR